jgi:hypothetical protein
MSLMLRAATQVLILAGLALTGCANGTDNFFTTGALGSSSAASSEPKIDPACVTLASRIEALRREGLAEKIEKAAAKKYKLKQAELVKVDQLTKSNAEFQLRCSTVMPSATQLSSASAAPIPAPAPAKASAAKAAKAAPQN